MKIFIFIISIALAGNALSQSFINKDYYILRHKNNWKKQDDTQVYRSISGIELIAYRKALMEILGKTDINECMDEEKKYKISFFYKDKNTKFLYIYFTYMRCRKDVSKLTEQERLELIRKEKNGSDKSRLCCVDLNKMEVISNVRQR